MHNNARCFESYVFEIAAHASNDQLRISAHTRTKSARMSSCFTVLVSRIDRLTQVHANNTAQHSTVDRPTDLLLEEHGESEGRGTHSGRGSGGLSLAAAAAAVCPASADGRRRKRN